MPNDDFPVSTEGTIDDDALMILAELLVDLHEAREADQTTTPRNDQ